MSPQELLEDIRRQLTAQACAAHREGVINYFREPVDPYGVRTPDARRIAAGAYRCVKTWSVAERNRFCNGLWKSGKLEEGVIAIDIYRRFRRQCGQCEFRLFESWINRFVRNWAHCDGVSAWLVGAAIENLPDLAGEMLKWTQSVNRWKRRAAAVSLVPSARKARNGFAILDVSNVLLVDGDDMVRKGVGWLLKDAYPAYSKEVVEFLRNRREEAPRLVLRIAAEKMTPADRALILS